MKYMDGPGYLYLYFTFDIIFAVNLTELGHHLPEGEDTKVKSLMGPPKYTYYSHHPWDWNSYVH